jgi:hypothetical protein
MLGGLLLAHAIQNLLHSYMVLHISLQRPMSKSLLDPFCKCIEMMKAVELTCVDEERTRGVVGGR